MILGNKWDEVHLLPPGGDRKIFPGDLMKEKAALGGGYFLLD
jgi:hypothetical protein